ncbi:DinB family protein [Terrimonas sp. NA20]|uniref:DinB family protein n=1 Tax=Terrimonas ginsenosidimutans TaxID=2908004 RepID=A0ABS9KN98_9BACT|nr:DinB family protein [Terrimonas ginsenosidimutans]MCG2613797.1 DinB family protein [Terrimonas ginsenosidimutans]
MEKELLAQIDSTEATLLELYRSLSQEELNTVPFAGSWTPGQLSEHLEKSCGIDTLYAETADTSRDPASMVESIKAIFLDFSTKMQSPDFIYPRGDHYNKEEVYRLLKTRWTDIRKAATTLDLSRTCLAFEFPGSGALTRFEWLSFFVIHTQRHLHQLRNMRKALRGENV